jgi:hypothetical protein
MYSKVNSLASLILVLGLTTSLFGAGLLGHWTFDEGAGDVAQDSSGNNNGTLQGNPAWVAGSSGGTAVNFDDSDDIM